MYSSKAYAKVNIFLKITGKRDDYHTLLSRFVKVYSLYDTIEFVPSECDTFTIEGCDGIEREKNTIYSAYRALNERTGDLEILDFFYHHKVVVRKRIPEMAGLGGGSSDAGTFMRMVAKACNLSISIEELAEIGSTIGADLPFFIYDYDSANVSGIGEIVEPFDEKVPDIDIYTPDIECSTPEIYRIFRERFYDSRDTPDSYAHWSRMRSEEILESVADPYRLNDLYEAALIASPSLREVAPEGWFFSGSGSSFFKISE